VHSSVFDIRRSVFDIHKDELDRLYVVARFLCEMFFEHRIRNVEYRTSKCSDGYAAWMRHSQEFEERTSQHGSILRRSTFVRWVFDIHQTEQNMRDVDMRGLCEMFLNTEQGMSNIEHRSEAIVMQSG
jgi:hypothetical protein